LHLSFWKKKHKYHTKGGGTCTKIGGEKAWLRKKNGKKMKKMKKKSERKKEVVNSG
jgi:hypothetical protein